MEKLFLKSQSQKKFIKQIKSRNNNLNTIKLLTSEKPLSSNDIEDSKDLRTIQSYDNNNINKKVFASLKSINFKKNKKKNQIEGQNQNRFATKSNDENGQKNNEVIKILNGLKKFKPNRKIKLYDTYKFKEFEEENIDNDKDEENQDYYDKKLNMVKKKRQKEIKTKRIYQKET